MSSTPPPHRGHRVLPHTADVIVQAWGTDLAACCEEAVAGLTDTYLDASAAQVLRTHGVHLPAGPAAHDTVMQLLDEVIFVLDTSPAVPVAARVRPGEGGLDVELLLADPQSVLVTGAAPKAISRSQLRFEPEPGGVHCAFLVDV